MTIAKILEFVFHGIRYTDCISPRGVERFDQNLVLLATLLPKKVCLATTQTNTIATCCRRSKQIGLMDDDDDFDGSHPDNKNPIIALPTDGAN
jgi:hypothetical protein